MLTTEPTEGVPVGVVVGVEVGFGDILGVGVFVLVSVGVGVTPTLISALI
jgi:hypothetical protein